MSAWSALPSPGIAIFALPGENFFGLPSGPQPLATQSLAATPPEVPSTREFWILVLDAVVADN